MKIDVKAIVSHWNPNEKTIKEIVENVNSKEKLKLCIICGGEITWDMTNISTLGKGGRNLHLTLLFQYQIHEMFAKMAKVDSKIHVWFSSAGTDGIDGSTDVAGSIAYNYYHEDLDTLSQYLSRFDSFTYYKRRLDQLINPGHTGTNVMDIHILLFEEE